MLNPIYIDATTLVDAWFQSLYRCVEEGRDFSIDEGSFKGQKRLEFDSITVRIRTPHILPLLPQLSPLLSIPDPVDPNYLDDYLPYLMTGEEKEGESYTYGQRICKQPIHSDWVTSAEGDINEDIFKNSKGIWQQDTENIITFEEDDMWYLNQMELMIWTYKNHGHRNNQMILQVGQPSDMLLVDPPCLRHIDTRIQDGKLHFYPYFRSWDLYGGFPANLAAIEMMKQYCAEQIGVENGEIIAYSKGLHVYKYTWEIIEAIRGRTIEEFREEAKKNES